MIALFSFILVLALSPILATPVSAQVKKAAPAIVQNVNVGDVFTYRVVETRPGRKRALTTTRKVVETVMDLNASYEQRSGVRKLIRDTITGRTVFYDVTPGVEFWMNEPLSLTPLRNGGAWRAYPLVIAKGKTIKQQPTETTVDLGSSKSFTRTAVSQTIHGRETLRVGKLRLRCTKILETTTVTSWQVVGEKKLRPKTTTRRAYLWYSPELQTLAKYTTSEGARSFTQTLQSYTPATPRTAYRESAESERK